MDVDVLKEESKKVYKKSPTNDTEKVRKKSFWYILMLDVQ